MTNLLQEALQRDMFLVALLLTVAVFQEAAFGRQISLTTRDTALVADTMKTFELPEIVVTATRVERGLSETGRSVTLISAEHLKNTIFLSVGEVLTRQEGLYTVGSGQNPGMIQSLFMRGASSNHTAIFIDDIRITDPSGVNNALDASELSPMGIDRIEIVRGSHSTLYGSSAIGGVVNILTQKNRTPGFRADAELRGGTFGADTWLLGQALNVNYSDPAGVYVNANIQNMMINGLDATIDTVRTTGVFKNRDLDGHRKLDIGGKIGFQNGTFDLSVGAMGIRQKTDIDDGAYRDDENHTVDFSRGLLTYGASYAFDRYATFKLLGGYSGMKRIVTDDSSVVDQQGSTDQSFYRGEWRGTTLTHEFQAALRLPHVEAVAGLGMYRETMGSTSRYFTRTPFGPFEFLTDIDSLGLKTTTTNLFVHADLGGGWIHPSLSQWWIGLGVRVNNHSTFGGHLTYEVNPSVRISEAGLLYASYSTGFNAPSLYQLFSPNQDFTSGITLGNRSLEPERSVSYEAGLKYTVGKWNLAIAVFRTIVGNTIEYVYLWDKNVGIDTLGNDFARNDFRGDTYLNIGTQTTTGVEASFSAEIGGGLTVSGNVSFLNGKLRYTPAQIEGDHTQGHHVQLFNSGEFLDREVEVSSLIRRPSTMNLSVAYALAARSRLQVDVRQVGSRLDNFYDSKRGPYGALGAAPVGRYTIVDAAQHVSFDDHLSATVRLENIFNAQYSEINGFTTRGRGIFLNLRYEFHDMM
jgi:vitamin B12 transporter